MPAAGSLVSSKRPPGQRFAAHQVGVSPVADLRTHGPSKIKSFSNAFESLIPTPNNRPEQFRVPPTAKRKVSALVSKTGRLATVLLMLVPVSTAPAEQALTIFGNALPETPVVSDAEAVTLGVKFRTAQPGKVLGIRFYRGAASRDGYAVKLFAANGSLLAVAKAWKDTCVIPCWEQVNFRLPVSIAANTTYIAAYYTSRGRYAVDKYGLTNGHSAGPLLAPASDTVGGNGVYTYSAGFPNQTWENSNYYVDVSFTAAASAPAHLTLSFDPPNPSIAPSAPAGTVVATIIAVWSDGTSFIGNLSFGPPFYNDRGTFAIAGNKLIINPVGPGLSAQGGTIRDVTITATQ